MLFNAALFLFNSLLLSPVVLALPPGLGAPIARRGGSSQGNNPLVTATRTGPSSLYSDNWAGAWLSEANGTFDGISGIFIVPSAAHSNGSSAAFGLALDGISCSNGTLGVGVSINVDDQGTTYSAWYQWYPDSGFQSFLDPIQISAGDALNLTVNAWSPTSGTVKITNLNNSQVVSKDLNSSIPLCKQDVVWNVANYGLGNGHPLADFGAVTYKNAHATGEDIWFSPLGANTTNVIQNGTLFTDVTTGETSVTIRYL